MLGGHNSQREYSGIYLERDKGGLRLGEHERHDFSIKKEDGFMVDPDSVDVPYVHMYIEDSLGNRHTIPRSREYLVKLHS